MDGGDGFEAVRDQVHELEVQVSAFTGLGQALKEVDGVLGEVSEELGRTGNGASLRTRWTVPREARAVALA